VACVYPAGKSDWILLSGSNMITVIISKDFLHEHFLRIWSFMGYLLKTLLAILLLSQLFGGHSATETQASDLDQSNSRKLIATKSTLFRAAEKILILQGFEILNLDEAAGIVSTDVTPMRVNVSGCDCEMNNWQKKDQRPIINVRVDVIVNDNRIAIQACISGDYREEQISEKMIEDDLFDQISRYLN